MKKLTVDEIIQGLVDAYERLLVLESHVSRIDAHSPYDSDYAEVKGEVKALRWVLGQEHQSALDSSMPNKKEKEHG
jgi:hypothetical protein